MHKVTVTAIIIGAVAMASNPAAATAPMAGTYAAAIYVQTATTYCLDQAGATYAGALNYSGFTATKMGLRIPLAQSGQTGVSTQLLTVTSGVGTTAPKGSFTWKGQGVGVGFSVHGTFSGTIKEIDSVSFAAQVTETYTASAYGSCTETLQVALTRVGASQ